MTSTGGWPYSCIICGRHIALGEPFVAGSGEEWNVRKHAACLKVEAPVVHHVHTMTCPVHEDQIRDLTRDRDEWKGLAQELRDRAVGAEMRLRAALLLVEWVEQDYRGRKCGGCTGLDPELSASGGHRPGCPIAAALASTPDPPVKT